MRKMKEVVIGLIIAVLFLTLMWFILYAFDLKQQLRTEEAQNKAETERQLSNDIFQHPKGCGI